jgi:hypothetical protein
MPSMLLAVGTRGWGSWVGIENRRCNTLMYSWQSAENIDMETVFCKDVKLIWRQIHGTRLPSFARFQRGRNLQHRQP